MNIGVSFIQHGSEGHAYIRSTGKPLTGMNTLAGLVLCNQYTKWSLSLKQWRKEKRTVTLNFEEHGQQKVSRPFNYLAVAEFIRGHGHFDPNAFGLWDIGCMWLDHSTDMKTNFYKSDDAKSALGMSVGDLQTHYYGPNYPIQPLLTREGHLYGSFQPQLIRRIIRDRTNLIATSHDALNDDWVFDLRNLISNAISLLDIALNQLYIKAQYDPLPGWTFDAEALGMRHGQKLNNKLKWVRKISGRSFDIESEFESLNTLRMLRNHLMHFDPPSLVVTIEEATKWLNQIIDIGKILFKMRAALGVEVSVDLANFVLQHEAVFVPFSNGIRVPLQNNRNTDYRSSTWPSEDIPQ